VTEQLECIELCLGVGEEQVESLWVRIKRQASTADTVVGVGSRPPDWEEEVDKAFYRQMKVGSQSQMLVPTTLISAGKTAQLATTSPGCSCRALRIIF